MFRPMPAVSQRERPLARLISFFKDPHPIARAIPISVDRTRPDFRNPNRR